MSELNKLADLVQRERESILDRWRLQVRNLPSAKDLDKATLDDHIPVLLDELAEALREKSDQTIPEALAESSPPIHGRQRLKDAFDIEEVVAEYNLLRGCIHSLADDHALNLQGRPLHIINRVFDHAIGLALQTYATERALEVQRRRDEYLAFVAHDLRTPLSAISLAESILNMTLQGKTSSSETSKILGALRRNVQHLEQLVCSILEENANLQTETGMKLVCREFDLWALIEALVHDLHPVAETAGTRLINDVPDGLFAYADAGFLKRLFQNLIANAIRYTPKGEVVIGASETPGGNVIEFWVKDNGAGIPAEFIDQIFEKGETDPDGNEGLGLGLGLAIVKTVAEAHGGTIKVESKEGVGTTFRFSLPTKASSLQP